MENRNAVSEKAECSWTEVGKKTEGKEGVTFHLHQAQFTCRLDLAVLRRPFGSIRHVISYPFTGSCCQLKQQSPQPTPVSERQLDLAGF